ncbi:MAG: hypothetical protein ACR2JC_08030 [Chloroflexota bacterium]
MKARRWHRNLRVSLVAALVLAGSMVASGTTGALAYTGWTTPFTTGTLPWQPWKSVGLDSTLSASMNTYSGNIMFNYQMTTIPGVNGFDLTLAPHWNWTDRGVQTDMG